MDEFHALAWAEIDRARGCRGRPYVQYNVWYIAKVLIRVVRPLIFAW